MGFKENLMKKMEIEKLAKQVAATVAPQADAAKFDKDGARRLFEMGGVPYVDLKDRDLELYILEDDGEKKSSFWTTVWLSTTPRSMMWPFAKAQRSKR